MGGLYSSFIDEWYNLDSFILNKNIINHIHIIFFGSLLIFYSFWLGIRLLDYTVWFILFSDFYLLILYKLLSSNDFFLVNKLKL
jgi:hypothetical protein